VQIEGKAPIINGWAFIATLEHDEDGTIIRRIPTFSEDEFDLTQYRNATPENCDHCGYKRRRNDTYIVGWTGSGDHEQYIPMPAVGDTKQVGSNCLKDFTGHESPQQVAKLLEQVRDLLDDLRGGGYSEGGFVPRYSTRDFMAHTVLEARTHGWVSKKQAWEDNSVATAQAAETSMRKTPAAEPSDSDYRWADKIIEWAEALTEDELQNDYLWNVHTVLKNGSLTDRQFGIAASATQAYKRMIADTHIGAVGERIEITFVVERVFDNDTYNTYVLRDKLGRSLRWSTNIELAVGAQYTGGFNVKGHSKPDQEKYGKQTFINYPRDLEKLS
jgi:hypothetical protein